MIDVIKRIWNDPVGSKVIAAGIIALAAWAGALIVAYWDPSIATPLAAGIVIGAVIGLALDRLSFRPRKSPAPAIGLVDASVTHNTNNPNLSYPLKCHLTLRNNSRECIDVRLHRYLPRTVDVKKFPLDVLQVKLREWYPKEHGVDRIAVYPTQVFQAWLGFDEKIYSEEQIKRLRGQLGTLILDVNGTPVHIDV